jgi:hypothetical protein
MCVKCGGTHNSKERKRNKETPATRALCEGNQLANYKACEHYHNLIKGNNTLRNNTQSTPPASTNIYEHNIHFSVNSQRQRSYTEVTKSHTNQVENSATTLTKLMDEFKGLFNQLLQQNSMIMNMLPMRINEISKSRQIPAYSPMECKRFAKPQRRNYIILTTKLH